MPRPVPALRHIRTGGGGGSRPAFFLSGSIAEAGWFSFPHIQYVQLYVCDRAIESHI